MTEPRSAAIAQAPPTAASRPWISLATAVAAGLSALAIVLWQASLGEVDLRDIDDLGLVSVLPVTFLLALVAIVAAYVLLISQRRVPKAWLAAVLVLLILVLYGTLTIIETEPRYPVTWRHVGVTDVILRTEAIDPNIDAYFSWPGFFVLSAFATQLAGLPDATWLAGWAPVYYNILYLPALVLLLRSLTSNDRHVWLAILFFYLANWVGQDYFSPQGLNYFFYLTAIGLLLAWFRRGSVGGSATAGPDPPFGRLRVLRRAVIRYERGGAELLAVTPIQRAALLGAVIAIFVFSVASHQLTPFAIVGGVAALTVLRILRVPGLPLLMLVVIAAWLLYLATAFLAGHLPELVEEFGRLGGNVTTGVTERVQGSEDHRLIVNLRLATTLGVWVLALLGGLRRLRRGNWDVSAGILAAAPFSLVALQDYGGEMLLRVYLFTLPFMCFFVAALLVDVQPSTSRPGGASGSGASVPPDRPSPHPLGARRATVAALLSILLGTSLLFTRYGNERMDWVSSEELAAINTLYDMAPPGSTLVAVANHVPWKFREYEVHRHLPPSSIGMLESVEAIEEQFATDATNDAFLLVTRSERAFAELFLGVDPRAWDRLVAEIDAWDGVRLVYANQDASIYERVHRSR